MEEDFIEVNDVPEGTYDIVETNNEITDADEPLDLGEPHVMNDEEFEDLQKSLNDDKEENSDIVVDKETDEFKDEADEPLDLGEPHIMSDEEFEDLQKSLNDGKEEKLDILDDENNDAKGYLDDEDKWHGNEEDEPLFGKDGELRDLNDKEIPLSDEEKENLNEDTKNESIDTTEDADNEDIETESEDTTEDTDNEDTGIESTDTTQSTNNIEIKPNKTIKDEIKISEIPEEPKILEIPNEQSEVSEFPGDEEKVSDFPTKNKNIKKERKSILNNIVDRFKGKNKSNKDITDSNTNINVNNEIDDNYRRNDFMAGIQSQVETRENVLKKDVEKIKNGNWNKNPHKPGGTARTPNDKGKIKDDEDDPII